MNDSATEPQPNLEIFRWSGAIHGVERVTYYDKPRNEVKLVRELDSYASLDTDYPPDDPQIHIVTELVDGSGNQIPKKGADGSSDVFLKIAKLDVLSDARRLQGLRYKWNKNELRFDAVKGPGEPIPFDAEDWICTNSVCRLKLEGNRANVVFELHWTDGNRKAISSWSWSRADP